MTFQVQTMIGNEALVSGTDKLGNTGKMVVSTTQWDELKSRKNFSSAKEDFDKAVEEFFKPLTKAAKKAQKKLAASQEQDPISYVVIDEGVEGVEAQPRQLMQLSRDSIVLRLIEEGDTDRLVWVDDHTLAILAKS